MITQVSLSRFIALAMICLGPQWAEAKLAVVQSQGRATPSAPAAALSASSVNAYVNCQPYDKVVVDGAIPSVSGSQSGFFAYGSGLNTRFSRWSSAAGNSICPSGKTLVICPSTATGACDGNIDTCSFGTASAPQFSTSGMTGAYPSGSPALSAQVFQQRIPISGTSGRDTFRWFKPDHAIKLSRVSFIKACMVNNVSIKVVDPLSVQKKVQ
jgi:hypothetical protein